MVTCVLQKWISNVQIKFLDFILCRKEVEEPQNHEDRKSKSKSGKDQQQRAPRAPSREKTQERLRQQQSREVSVEHYVYERKTIGTFSKHVS